MPEPTYTGKLVGAMRKGGRGYGVSYRKIREAIEERHDALANMGATRINADFTYGGNFDLYFYSTVFPPVQAGKSLMKSSMPDASTTMAGDAMTHETYDTPVDLGNVFSTGKRYNQITFQWIIDKLGILMPSVSAGKNQDNIISIFRAAAGAIRMFPAAPAKPVDYRWSSANKKTLWSGPYGTALAAQNVAFMPPSSLSSWIMPKINSHDYSVISTNNFCAAVGFKITASVYKAPGVEEYYPVLDLNSYYTADEASINGMQSPNFKDDQGNTVTGSTKAVCLWNYGTQDPADRLNTQAPIFDYEQYKSFSGALDVSGVIALADSTDIQFSGLEITYIGALTGGSAARIFADYSNCFPSLAYW